MLGFSPLHVLLFLIPYQANVEENGTAATYWFGAYRDALTELSGPSDVVIDGDGLWYVANSLNGTVDVYGPDAQRRFSIRDLLEPSGLAVANGELFVSDRGRDQVAVYSLQGKRLRVWGRSGHSPGELRGPTGIAVEDGQVYLADTGNHRVQVFDLKGRLLFAVAQSPGKAMNQPGDLVIGPDHNLYIADTGNHRIVVADGKGAFLRTFGDYGVYPGLFDTPSGLLWNGERLLVVDQRNHRIQAFAADGKFLGIWGQHESLPHEGLGKLHYPVAAAIDPKQQYALVVEAIEDRVQILDPDPQGMAEPNLSSAAIKRTHFGKHLATDGGFMVIAEPEAHYVFVYDLRLDIPVNVNKFGERGDQFGLMLDTSAVWLSIPERRLMTTDLHLNRIQEYHLDYKPGEELKFLPEMTQFTGSLDIGTLAQSVPRLTWPIEATALKTDGKGQFHLIDGANAKIHVFDKEWQFLRSYGGPAKRGGQLSLPVDLAFSPKGDRIYVVDGRLGRVIAFDERGKARQRIGEKSGPGQLGRPFGVACDSNGDIYVSDSAAHRIVRYDDEGHYRQSWGKRGDKMGELWYPAGLAIDQRSRLFVVDYGNHRIQIFDCDGTWRVSLGAGRAYSWKAPPAEVKKP